MSLFYRILTEASVLFWANISILFELWRFVLVSQLNNVLQQMAKNNTPKKFNRLILTGVENPIGKARMPFGFQL